ncbi:hypothetical protein L248_2934 [Schleiferilactobacillus shenzhenensis LY-73]|uniref:Uncharacterized protein n=1 Tax=Schleiferilactobacillus shenzhenensis LY-73 TaxID=1231336 RepID=U4TM23_9LACO|nr:hypothetical protein L248_2934 [Schleiferilactobacillus shenzhenensis LY-73]
MPSVQPVPVSAKHKRQFAKALTLGATMGVGDTKNCRHVF